MAAGTRRHFRVASQQSKSRSTSRQATRGRIDRRLAIRPEHSSQSEVADHRGYGEGPGHWCGRTLRTRGAGAATPPTSGRCRGPRRRPRRRRPRRRPPGWTGRTAPAPRRSAQARRRAVTSRIGAPAAAATGAPASASTNDTPFDRLCGAGRHPARTRRAVRRRCRGGGRSRPGRRARGSSLGSHDGAAAPDWRASCSPCRGAGGRGWSAAGPARSGDPDGGHEPFQLGGVVDVAVDQVHRQRAADTVPRGGGPVWVGAGARRRADAPVGGEALARETRSAAARSTSPPTPLDRGPRRRPHGGDPTLSDRYSVHPGLMLEIDSYPKQAPNGALQTAGRRGVARMTGEYSARRSDQLRKWSRARVQPRGEGRSERTSPRYRGEVEPTMTRRRTSAARSTRGADWRATR